MEELRNNSIKTIEDWLFGLIRSVSQKESPSLACDLSAEEFQELLTLATRHEVQPIVAYGLLLSGGLSGEQKKECQKIVYMAMLRYERMEQERKNLCALLENAQLPFIPLKGAVIRSLYPEPWLRTSCDIDVLVKDIDRAVEVLEGNGYIYRGKGSHDVQLKSPLGITIELHFQLIETNEKIDKVLEQVWDYAHPANPDTYQYVMDAEMFYFYHIAHMAKHFLFGGFGIRSMVDTWLLNRYVGCDEEKKNQFLQNGGLLVFSEKVEQLSSIWFDEGDSDELLQELQGFILNGGVFGSKSNVVKLHRTKSETTMEFILLRIFMPYKRMVLRYPVLKKYPVLLPVFWIRRWIELFLRVRKVRNAMYELTLNKNLDKETVAVTKWMLQELDLF